MKLEERYVNGYVILFKIPLTTYFLGKSSETGELGFFKKEYNIKFNSYNFVQV